MNPLEQYPEIRKVVYSVFWAVSIIILALNGVYMAIEGNFPQWLEVVNIVWGVVSGATGYTARANVDTASQRQLP